MIRERVVAGLANARHCGKQLGRRKLLFDRDRALNLHRGGKSIREIAKALQVNRGTIHRFVLGQKGAPGPEPPKSARLPKAA
jgi:DNA invertase Pin-like site-specific DNA recombinase